MPPSLEPGVLYVSREFETAAHLCACGCGRKVRTPLGPTEWEVSAGTHGPSLWPSIGNWQFPCRSHYVIRDGGIEWARTWTPAQIARGRDRETARRARYFGRRARLPWWSRLCEWTCKTLFRRPRN
ncbi:DUF6527 family protein [Tsuneonella troitsensis]|uniref:DUF6527 family protein n=1 Tax=Tsuneonella troitsensis TaxID=292222 RepID=UPI0038999211